jgi:hypothetical protein
MSLSGYGEDMLSQKLKAEQCSVHGVRPIGTGRNTASQLLPQYAHVRQEATDTMREMGCFQEKQR